MFHFNECKIPLSQDVVFPDLCIGCLQLRPETTVTFGTNQQGWWTYILWTFGRRYRWEVPACPRCRRKLIIQIWMHRLIMVAIVAVAIFAVTRIFEGWPRGPLKRILMMGTGLLLSWPGFAAMWHWYPLPLELDVDAQVVTWTFGNIWYALEFRRANFPDKFPAEVEHEEGDPSSDEVHSDEPEQPD